MEGLFKADNIQCFAAPPRKSSMSFWTNYMAYQKLKFYEKHDKQENSLGGCHEKLEKMVSNVKT